MDKEAWGVAVHGVTKSRTELTDMLIGLFSLQTDEASQYCKIRKFKTSLF